MEVTRSIEQVVGRKLVLDLPENFQNRQVEVIVLTVEDDTPLPKTRPHPSIAGKMTIHGDIFDSVPEADWDLS